MWKKRCDACKKKNVPCNRKATFHYKGKLPEVFRAGLNEIKYDYVDSEQHFYPQYHVAATDMKALCKKQTTLQEVVNLGFTACGDQTQLKRSPARSWQHKIKETLQSDTLLAIIYFQGQSFLAFAAENLSITCVHRHAVSPVHFLHHVVCSFDFFCFSFHYAYLMSNCCFSTLGKRVINGVGWLDDRHGLSPILYWHSAPLCLHWSTIVPLCFHLLQCSLTIGLLHAMAFMMLLLVGWVIWNNKPLTIDYFVKKLRRFKCLTYFNLEKCHIF